jgi:hypothetical protein
MTANVSCALPPGVETNVPQSGFQDEIGQIATAHIHAYNSH